jgi:hypothetical protein
MIVPPAALGVALPLNCSYIDGQGNVMSGEGEPIAQGTYCEWCGAEFADDVTPPAAKTKAARPAPVTEGEPLTHCEWCGAEYPVPDAR